MAENKTRFSDGASYDVMMGEWSRKVGKIFLDWLAPPPGADWLDVGCGSGAFTALVAERCAPGSILGLDPSESQLDFARKRGLDVVARFQQGDAMALPVADDAVDVAVAALVVHFMPDPAQGLREMARVVRSGGLVGAYSWDMDAGGFPYHALQVEMEALGFPASNPPSPEASEAEAMRQLFVDAGLVDLQSRNIAVTRTFADFEHYWTTAVTAPRVAITLSKTPPETVEELRRRLRANLKAEANGEIVPVAKANAVIACVP